MNANASAGNGRFAHESRDAPTCDLSPGRNLLFQLLEGGAISLEDWQELPDDVKAAIAEEQVFERMTSLLVTNKMLTRFQASHLQTGGLESLVLGNYRILDRIGAGGMGVVYRGEHKLLRRPVAIKVLQTFPDENQIILQRFFVEMRALAKIHHPNIVCAFDSGMIGATVANPMQIYYLVMEHVAGLDLEQLVARLPMNVTQACDLVFQVAGALNEAHKLNLIHRDIKPSNILVTPDGVAKLLDFGLALHRSPRRLTTPGTLLGTLSFMAPEQVNDAAGVDIRADIFALGATFYYCLTGRLPFPSHGSVTHQIASRLNSAPPELRPHRTDVSPDLEAVLRRMMAHHRDDRYSTPQSVMRALLPFVKASTNMTAERWKNEAPVVFPEVADATPRNRCGAPARILIIDDEPLVRELCKAFFRREKFECQEACDGEAGLQIAEQEPFDVVLLDIDMPKLSGTETLRRLRMNPLCDNMKVIMISGGISADDMSEVLDMGADDYLTKPLTRLQLVSRTKAALLHKASQDRSELLNRQLLRMNAELEQSANAKKSDLAIARKVLIQALAKIVESRTDETPGHLSRMQSYVRCLGHHASRLPRFAAVLDEPFLRTLESCAILHDIGNVAMPDDILCRTKALELEDEVLLQSHTTIGAETLRSVAKRDASAIGFWQMAIDIARHHHERHDGTGYPDGLAGNDIPLSARLVALADAYDTARLHGAGGAHFSHHAAVEMIVHGSPGRFDPLLLQSFQQCAPDFEIVFRTCSEEDRPR